MNSFSMQHFLRMETPTVRSPTRYSKSDTIVTLGIVGAGAQVPASELSKRYAASWSEPKKDFLRLSAVCDERPKWACGLNL